ncbi:MAG: PEP-utilizing enzyme, partial [bacterium]|nr:PEP-utilizing enzyme [bacterium]
IEMHVPQYAPSFLGKVFGRHGPTDGVEVLRTRLDKFRDLVKRNNQVLELIADAGEKLGGEYVFDIQYLRALAEQLEEAVRAIAYNLNVITDNRFPQLEQAFERVAWDIRMQLAGRFVAPPTDWTLDLAEIDEEAGEAVGEKMARLGTIRRELGCPTPDGFVVTAYACQVFLESCGVAAQLREWFEPPAETAAVELESRARMLQARILRARLPRELERALRRRQAALQRRCGRHPMAVRSSALGEDGEFSFAGQYKTVLGVGGDQLIEAYRQVVASLYSPAVMCYRRHHGLPPASGLMAVGCLCMVDARAAGVVYSLDPVNPERDALVVGAAWGLGPTVVEGSDGADRYELAREAPHRVIGRRIAHKVEMLALSAAGTVTRAPVAESRRNQPALDDAQLGELARTALRIESLMKGAQDIEWALDEKGRLFILQARPLRCPAAHIPLDDDMSPVVDGFPVLLKHSGTVACRGIGAGRVHVVSDEEALDELSDDLVLVARTSTPRLAVALKGASAVITDVGTSTGHLAAIARQFRIPTIVDTGNATEILRGAGEVTVDAEENIVYRGRISPLLHRQLLRNLSSEDPAEFRLLRRILKRIAPLHLKDPQSAGFTAAACTTYHDIARFAHEKAVQRLTEGEWVNPSTHTRYVHQLACDVPVDLVLIDLGGGLNAPGGERTVTPRQVDSAPLRALLCGLCREGVWATAPADVDLDGFMASATRSMVLTSPQARRPERNLAIISDAYLNLSLHLGYHFNIVDCYLTETLNDNYIYFRFAGGATELTRRSRRVALLKCVLAKYDFVVEGDGDLIIARIKKIAREAMEERLAMIGRLIGFTRQLDIYLRDDSLVERYAQGFLAGFNSPAAC